MLQSSVPRHMWLTLRRREALWFHIFVAPWIIGFLVFTLYPTVAALYLSFTRYNALHPPIFVGLANYHTLFQDPVFFTSLRVTFTYAIIAVPLHLAIGLLLAVLLNQRIRAMRFIRTVYYMPAVLPAVIVALMWIWLFDYNFGLINYIIYSLLHIRGPDWLGDPHWVMPAIILASLWGVGAPMVIYLAGLQSIPKELYEAAEVDGANQLRRFFAITIPLISPVTFFNFIIGLISSLQIFTNIYVLTGGGPDYASYFYNLYLYNNAFQFFKLGIASAQAWILFVIIMVLTLLAFRTAGRAVYYGGS